MASTQASRSASLSASGYRALREQDAQKVGAPFPHNDPRFGSRRYRPAVIRWLNLYYVERPAAPEQMLMVGWERLYEKPPRKARGPALDNDRQAQARSAHSAARLNSVP
jgi:hypothetical protein